MTAPSIPLEGTEPRSRVAAGLAALRDDTRLAWAPLIAVVAIALALNTWHLSEVGLGNTYYAAAVRSMTASWSNFFFGAFDPGGMITVDKPPVFLWFGAAAVRVFGYSSWALLLPSAIAGAATVGLLWLIVRRTFGTFAATIAALTLAVTPIAVAVDRLNLPEPFFILALVGAAGAITRSLEEPRGYRWAALAGALVGIAFNAKMLAAWIPGPALVLALLVGVSWARGTMRETWRPMLGRVAVLGIVTLAVSASWMVVTDLTPASARPYVGGSTNNSVLNLAFGYNGFGRVEGQGFGGNSRNAPGRIQPATPPATGAPGGAFDGGQNRGPNAVPNAAPNAGRPGGAMNGPGGIIAGEPGPLRMIDAANGGQIGWLLSFALLGAALALWLWRGDGLRRGSVVMWVGWVVLYGGVFSYAQGIYHSYYTAALAPGIAALTGIAALAAVEAVRRDRRWLVAPVVLVVAGIALQFFLQGRVPAYYGWLRPWVVGVAALGLLLLGASTLRRVTSRFAVPPALGMAVVVAALLLIPTGWSVSEAASPSLNTTLPQAGPRGGAAGRTFGSQAFDDGTSQLAAWLAAHAAPDETWQLAVTSAQNASTMIARHGLSVMAMGGFSGADPAMTVSRFASLVQDGEIRYVLANDRGGPGGGFGGAQPGGGFPGGAFPGGGRTTVVPGTGVIPRTGGAPGAGAGARPGARTPGAAPAAPAAPTRAAAVQPGASGVMSAVQQVCVPVTDSTLPAQYRSALYDCAGRAEALAARAGG